MTSKQVIILRKDLNMRKGKMVAQSDKYKYGIHTCVQTVDRITEEYGPCETEQW